MKNKLLLIAILLMSVAVKAQTDTTISTFVAVHQGNGSGLATRTVVDTFLMPHDLSVYATINMHVLLTCPTGGCDPWDRFANISVFHDTDWYEIGRYMTPYGKSCGWTIDVTDYRSMLSDSVFINSFIDTWTNPGWLVNIDFEFIAGTPVHPFVKVENLWNNYNVVYGDSTQPLNIPEITRATDADATGVKIKIVNTGHGQGNTANAAEFSQLTHHLTVNNVQTFNQYLWRSNCATNPCSPQNGTWTYNRAGWCPGADVIPSEYDITSSITPGQNVILRYDLQNYFNNCSPNNPACTASTCADCNYNYNGHTEPHYKIASQMITYLNTALGLEKITADKFYITPNPSTGIFRIHTLNNSTNITAEIYSSLGKLMWTGSIKNDQQLDLSFLSKGIYLMRVKSEKSSTTEKVIIR